MPKLHSYFASRDLANSYSESNADSFSNQNHFFLCLNIAPFDVRMSDGVPDGPVVVVVVVVTNSILSRQIKSHQHRNTRAQIMPLSRFTVETF